MKKIAMMLVVFIVFDFGVVNHSSAAMAGERVVLTNSLDEVTGVSMWNLHMLEDGKFQVTQYGFRDPMMYIFDKNKNVIALSDDHYGPLLPGSVYLDRFMSVDLEAGFYLFTMSFFKYTVDEARDGFNVKGASYTDGDFSLVLNSTADFSFDEISMPVPATIVLFGSGFLGLLGVRRRFW